MSIKSIAKKPLRPFTRRLFQRVDARLAPIDERVAALQNDMDALKKHVPTMLNVISSNNATAREWKRAESRLHDSIAQVEERGEFIRREVMFELRYGGRARGSENHNEPEIVDQEKFDSFQGHARLNLGCGHIPLEGYLNVDSRRLPGVDITADVGRLPFDAGEVTEIFSAHLLEHFPVEQLSRSLLPYWYSLLKPGGTFVAVVPDAQTMITEYAAGRYSFAELRLVTYGEQEYDGDFHFNMFTPDSLSELLAAAGFVGVTVQESARRNGACYEMRLAASKPAAD